MIRDMTEESLSDYLGRKEFCERVKAKFEDLQKKIKLEEKYDKMKAKPVEYRCMLSKRYYNIPEITVPSTISSEAEPESEESEEESDEEDEVSNEDREKNGPTAPEYRLDNQKGMSEQDESDNYMMGDEQVVDLNEFVEKVKTKR